VREARIENVTARQNDLYGFDFLLSGATDCWFTNCTAQASGLSGFHCASMASRYIGCKAFGNGSAGVPGNASGFYIELPFQYFTACDAQENRQAGFYLSGVSDSILSGCAALSNGDSAFVLRGVSNVIIEGCSVAHAENLLYQHTFGFDVDGGSINNRVSAIVSGVRVATVKPTAGLVGNQVIVNGAIIDGSARTTS
jgi:parallel beta-helix repeat protein